MSNFPQFSNLQLNHNFKEKGYVITPFIEESTCDELIGIYAKNNEDEQAEFGTTMKGSDQQKKAMISELLCKKAKENLPSLISGYEPLFGNFLVKKPNSKYKVGIHQDWTYVEEPKYRSFNIWVALCDIDAKNGGLKVLPKSHRLPLPIRYTPFTNNLKPFESIIRLKSKSITVKKGEAVIYDSALIHYSNENKTEETRYAFGCVCVPDDATSKHYHLVGNELLEYNVDRHFYNNFNPENKPTLKPLKSSPIKRINKLNLIGSFLKL